MSCCLQQKLINHNGDCVHKKLHVSLFQISSLFLIPKQKTRCGLANGIEDFQDWTALGQDWTALGQDWTALGQDWTPLEQDWTGLVEDGAALGQDWSA